MTDLTELKQLKLLVDANWRSARNEGAEGFDCVDEVEGEDRRWSRTNTTILRSEATGLLYAFDWEEGLTEMQENECAWPDVRRVERRERIITTVDYVEVTK